jgi:pimeloyl-ACP methyl ester carboxylesterase
MTKKKTGRPAAIFLTAAGGVLAAWTYRRYQRDLRFARKRVLANSRVVETSCGPIEYATFGEGYPVLVVHGAGGGYDQGLVLAQTLLGNGFHCIAPSRFGYLRTPLPADASAAAQADAHACLLDVLGIQQVAVVGASAGAPSSMQFALRHPDRCSAMVLLVPASYSPETSSPVQLPAPEFVYNVVLKSDFAIWLALKVARPSMMALLGVPPSVQARLGPAERERLSDFMHTLLPISLRQPGIRNDGRVVTSLERYPLEGIAAPTLVISADDDTYHTFAGARYAAQHILGAKFIGFESGGHLLVGNEEKVRAEIAEAIHKHEEAG